MLFPFLTCFMFLFAVTCLILFSFNLIIANYLRYVWNELTKWWSGRLISGFIDAARYERIKISSRHFRQFNLCITFSHSFPTTPLFNLFSVKIIIVFIVVVNVIIVATNMWPWQPRLLQACYDHRNYERGRFQFVAKFYSVEIEIFFWYRMFTLKRI